MSTIPEPPVGSYASILYTGATRPVTVNRVEDPPEPRRGRQARWVVSSNPQGSWMWDVITRDAEVLYVGTVHPREVR